MAAGRGAEAQARPVTSAPARSTAVREDTVLEGTVREDTGWLSCTGGGDAAIIENAVLPGNTQINVSSRDRITFGATRG
ncbi:hypothetical protein GCM10023259_010980 [Thermocatellispora tengchongensis]